MNKKLFGAWMAAMLAGAGLGLVPGANGTQIVQDSTLDVPWPYNVGNEYWFNVGMDMYTYLGVAYRNYDGYEGANPGWAYQNLGAIEANTEYVLSGDMTLYSAAEAGDSWLYLSAGSADFANRIATLQLTLPGAGTIGWANYQTAYTAPVSGSPVGETLFVVMRHLMTVYTYPEFGGQAAFDNVEVNTTLIPEPASFLLLGATGLLLWLRRRMRP